MGKGIFLIFLAGVLSSWGYRDEGDPYRHRAFLDPQRKYELEWFADWEARQVIFNVTVQTTGYVGLGLSRKGKMSGADIVIGGVKRDGSTYFSDRHAIANQLPVEDDRQDWTLLQAWERGGRTFLSISRPFDTCDEDHDLPINENDLSVLIWAYGETDDEIQYHFENRGSFNAYLLDPDLTPKGLDQIGREVTVVSPNVSIFRMTREITLPNQDTLYQCSFHRLPTRSKQHVIGFRTVFPTDRDRSHVHHLLLHRCRAPPGADPVKFFEPAARSGGSECYVLDLPNPLPVPYCRETVHVWGVGGHPIFFPDHAGLPMSETDLDQYYMLQVHYDNPNVVPDPVSVSLELFYTDKLRENDIGVLQLGDAQPGSTTLLVPPGDPNHIVHGHCASGCTERLFGSQGEANIIAVFAHTHISGRAVRALHFRQEQELPWVKSDNNYDFNFQQFRILQEERKLLAGDQLVVRCVYDTTGRNGSAITGGFSTREEMCTNFMYYYNRSPGFSMCRSEIRTPHYFNFLGIGNVTWNQSLRQTVVTSPREYAGMTMVDYATNEMTWNLATRRTLQRMQIQETHTSLCPRFYFEDPDQQIRMQIRDPQFLETGRLPGSDGKVYTSVDSEFEFESQFPRKGGRWMPESQCSQGRNHQGEWEDDGNNF